MWLSPRQAMSAHIAARVLDITLTSREMGHGERLPMAGMPVHAGEAHIARLISSGLRVAIAEQIGLLRIGRLVSVDGAHLQRSATVAS
jgi:DNA mismatch repair ATPase MutS